MTPEEENIFGAFMECLLAPLEGVTTYKYMTNLNVYLNSCSSTVNWTLRCSTLGYLFLTAQPAIFSTHRSTAFLPPKNPGIHLFIPDLEPTDAILSKLVRTHKHEVCLFNEYNAVDRVCNKVTSQLIPEKYYKPLSSRIIAFAKFTSLQILTHLITEYAELEDDDIEEIDSENEGTNFRQDHF